MMELFIKPLEWLWSFISNRRRLRLTVHKAILFAIEKECFFINATNMSKNREIEITHIWFDTNPPVHVIRPERPLPKRLKPDETWETWIEVTEVPMKEVNRVYNLARVRLSSGNIIKSKENKNVPPIGQVPGG